jgi:hypothetical protein
MTKTITPAETAALAALLSELDESYDEDADNAAHALLHGGEFVAALMCGAPATQCPRRVR